MPGVPGVYVEASPGGGRTIAGAATSIVAFIGRAVRGPTNKPVAIDSLATFERIFGGLWLDSWLGYVVRDFFANGGEQAIVVRLHHAATEPSPATGPPRVRAILRVHGLELEAANEGSWANLLRVRIDHDGDRDEPGERFDLTVRDGVTGAIERFGAVSVTAGHPRQLDRVLSEESHLVRVAAVPATRPAAHEGPADGVDIWEGDTTSTPVAAADAVTDGGGLDVDDFGISEPDGGKGLYALRQTDLFNLLCIPPYTATGDVDRALTAAAAAFCEERRSLLLVDPPADWTTAAAAKGDGSTTGVAAIGTDSRNAALYFPRLLAADPLREHALTRTVPCGAVAGVLARTDRTRGVWRAAAGVEAGLIGVPRLSLGLTSIESGELNALGINCLRERPAVGPVVWGARTLQGADRSASEWKYIPVRRTALFVEESILRGTGWAMAEPNDEPLWAQLRLDVGEFMHRLFRQGAFQGATPQVAYFVRCDRETTTQDDIDRGIVHMVVGFAPLRAAEFVRVEIRQLAGHIPP